MEPINLPQTEAVGERKKKIKISKTILIMVGLVLVVVLIVVGYIAFYKQEVKDIVTDEITSDFIIAEEEKLEKERDDRYIILLEQAIENSPQDVAAIVRLANFYLDINDLGKAIEYFNVALSIEPQNDNLMVALSDALKKSGKSEDAKMYLQKAITTNSKNLVAYYNLASILVLEQKKDEAIKVLQDGIYINPTSEELKYLLNKISEI